jgi:Zn-dependent peptidase ImmA (M78 family)
VTEIQTDFFTDILPVGALASMGSCKFNFRMLILAREAFGYTQRELSEKTGCKQSRLSKIEAGVLAPATAEIQSFMSALMQGWDYFFYCGEATVANVSFYRKTKSIPFTVFRRCNAQMNICRLQIEKRIGTAKLGNRELPYLPPEKNGGPKSVARILRQKWGIIKGPIPCITELVEDAGPVIVEFPFPSAKLDALCINAPGKTPIIFLNVDFPKSRRRLSLAHELGHLVMHTETHPLVEDEAWDFASEFLMPADEVSNQLKGLNLDKLGQLKKEWGVSMQAIIYYAKKLGKISDSYNRYLWMQIAKSGSRLNEPFEDSVPDEKPSKLEKRLKIPD